MTAPTPLDNAGQESRDRLAATGCNGNRAQPMIARRQSRPGAEKASQRPVSAGQGPMENTALIREVACTAQAVGKAHSPLFRLSLSFVPSRFDGPYP